MDHNFSNLQHTINLQQKASDPKNSSWVFASAGSGKTKILTDRVLRLLLDDVRPNKILCLTFTKVGALEMQQRIDSRLSQWILLDEEQLKEELKNLTGKEIDQNLVKKAQRLFNKNLDEEFKIKIQTIHSFCQNIIKIFPFEAEVKPNFEVIEQTQEKLFLKNAQKEVLKNALLHEELSSLVSKINASLHEEGFLELISTLLNKKEKLTFLKEKLFGIEGVIDEISSALGLKKEDSEEKIFNDFCNQINKQNLLTLVEKLNNSGKNDQKIAAIINNFVNNLQLEEFHNYHQAFFTQKNEIRKISKKISADLSLVDIIEKERNIILEFFDKLSSVKIKNNSALLLKFIDLILEKYNSIKNQNSYLDYNDLIVKTNILLENPEFCEWIKLKMDGNFDHILIDESQDTNHYQWNIIKALSEDFFSGMSSSTQKRSIFIVGDEKQSIYSFQGAETNIIQEVYNYFKEKIGSNLKKIDLNNSFRSLTNILDSVDKVFADETRKKAISKVSEFQKHNPIRKGLGKVEVWPQIFEEKSDKFNSYEWKIDFIKKESYKAKDKMAELIAIKIRNLIEKESLNYGDFMILLRNKTNGLDKSLAKFFNKYQIPFSSASKIKLSENLLACDLLSAAKFALLKEDDLNLACLLKSPIFEVLEDELLRLCQLKNQNNNTLYDNISGDLKEKLDKIYQNSQNLDVFEFFYQLIEENRQKFIAYFGFKGIEIIEKFTILVHDFSNNYSKNLQKFLEFIDKLNPEISLNNIEENRVNILTIHGSKGLQSKVVFIPDCCYNFNQLLSAKENISWIEGENFELPIWCSKKSEENHLLKAHRQIKIKEAKDEYLRLLYVAMTRAQDQLYIGGFGNARDEESWYEIIKNALPENIVEPETKCKSSNFLAKKNIVFTHEKLDICTEFSQKLPLQKSTSTDNLNQSQIKGKLIHKILEIFGKNYQKDKDFLINLAKYLIKTENFLSETVKDEIFLEINNFLHSQLFNEIFSDEIKCELEIAGKDNLVRIDLLKITDDKIIIIDYKTDDENYKEIPIKYRKQLLNYKEIIKEIYLNKKIECAILWTKSLKITHI